MADAIAAVVIFLVMQGLGAIIWGVQQSGRIDKLEQAHDSQKELLFTMLADIKERLIRVERHVLNGHYNNSE